MTPTTYWIARVEQYLSVYAERPTPRIFGFSGTLIISAHTDHWRVFGLPQEPAPGECWEVRWEERYVLDKPVHYDDGAHRLVPIARNVTAELKEKARD